MEPLKIIYDGYEIEIKSGGTDSMPIISMRKMITNTIEPDVIKLPTTIPCPDTPPHGWWENPPMWWYNPTVTTPVVDRTTYITSITSELENHIKEKINEQNEN